MESIMYMESLTLCPHLIGSQTGARCGVVNKFVKDIKDVNIKICMSRRHEACFVYFCSLQMVEHGGSHESVECLGI